MKWRGSWYVCLHKLKQARLMQSNFYLYITFLFGLRIRSNKVHMDIVVDKVTPAQFFSKLFAILRSVSLQHCAI